MASGLALVALILCFSFAANAQVPNQNDYPTALAPTKWTNSPSLPHNINFDYKDNSTVRSLLLRYEDPSKGYGVSFAIGFYCFPPCKSFSLSIFIVAANSGGGITFIAEPHVIWSANRAHPVSENATLELTSVNGLTLHDGDGSLVWTTNVTNRSVAGMNITSSGNLVLFDINDSIIWQSFDYPSDCLVIGQLLAAGMTLIANSSSTNITESQLYVTLLADGLFAFASSSPPQMYYPSQVIPGSVERTLDKSAFMKFMNGSLTMSSNSFNGKSLFNISLATTIQYLRLESDGHLKLYDFNGTSWKMTDDLFKLETCAYPTKCGKYSMCNDGQCTCPGTYFKLSDDRRADSDCTAITPLTCSDINNHHLTELKDLSYFNYYDGDFFNSTDEENCKKACLGNCSCKAAIFRSGLGNSNGSCLTLKEVFSFEYHDPKVRHTNSAAYIKVQIDPSASPSQPPSLPSEQSSLGVRLAAILGSTIGAFLLLLTLICIYLMCWRSGKEAEPEDEEFIEQLPGMPTRFTFEELRVATEEFSKKLGEGGFGTVFQGLWNGEKIAVKRLANVGHGQKDFLAEVASIGSIHHINLVRLIGFCADKLNRLLVYEYMCNGSLDKWISCRDERVPLDWPIRFKIITDIAKGLCYLHEECRQKIIHFDIKPENILLDEKFNAKVADFGLSKLIDRDVSRVMTGMRGTPGYLAPEWLTAMVTEKVDVYSFGVVVMEILCGRRNIDYSQPEESCQHLIKLLEEKSNNNEILDLIDRKLCDAELYEKEIDNVMQLAMWCLQWDCSRRPSMLMVVKVLEGAMHVETLLDYNFVSSIPMISRISGLVSQSAPLLASSSAAQNKMFSGS